MIVKYTVGYLYAVTISGLELKIKFCKFLCYGGLTTIMFTKRGLENGFIEADFQYIINI